MQVNCPTVTSSVFGAETEGFGKGVGLEELVLGWGDWGLEEYGLLTFDASCEFKYITPRITIIPAMTNMFFQLNLYLVETDGVEKAVGKEADLEAILGSDFSDPFLLKKLVSNLMCFLSSLITQCVRS